MKAPYAGQEPRTAGGATTVGRQRGNAHGHQDNKRGRIAIAVRFDEATFHRIGAEARRREVPFAHVVRDLVEAGMAATDMAAAPVDRSTLAVGDLFEEGTEGGSTP